MLLLDGRLLPADDRDPPPPEDRELPVDDRELPADDRELPVDGCELPADDRELPVDGCELPAAGERGTEVLPGLLRIELDAPVLGAPTIVRPVAVGGTTIGRDPVTLPDPLLGATSWRPPLLEPEGARTEPDGDRFGMVGR